MGMSLHGNGGHFRFNVMEWWRVLSLAEQHGWQPKGTQPPEWLAEMGEPTEGWPGDYGVNEGQVVTVADAQGLSDALERALADLSDSDLIADKVRRIVVAGVCELYAVNADTPVSPSEWFSGPRKEIIRAFVAFCRQGGFAIW